MAENWTRKTKREYKIQAEVAKVKHSGTKKYKHKIKIPQGFLRRLRQGQSPESVIGQIGAL